MKQHGNDVKTTHQRIVFSLKIGILERVEDLSDFSFHILVVGLRKAWVEWIAGKQIISSAMTSFVI